MSKYWCRCGRVVNKSTNAATTGNRDTESCTGCLYLLPYGPNVFAQGGYKKDVQGYECRMTDHPVIYGTHISSLGGPNDKTVLHVESLDFDFLDAITEWVHDTFTEEELTGGFQREALRAPEFMDGYRVTFYPSQNKKGVAAKQQLFHRFFHPDGTRIDMTPEEEKAKVLADIERGKDAVQGKEKATMKYKQQEEKIIPCTQEQIDSILFRITQGCIFAEAFHKVCRETKDRKAFDLAMLDSEMCNLMFNRDNLYIDKDNTLHCDHDVAGVHFYAGERMSYIPFPAVLDNLWGQAQKYKAFIGETVTSPVQEDLSDDENGRMWRSSNGNLYKVGIWEDGNSGPWYGILVSNDNGQSWRHYKGSPVHGSDVDKPQALIQLSLARIANEKGWFPLKLNQAEENPTPTDDLPWSAAATAAEGEHAESLAPAALTPTTETAAAVSEQVGSAAAPVPALDGMPTFDYSGLDEQTVVDLHLAEREYTAGKKLTEMGLRRMADGVAIAHDALCVTSTTKCRTGENGRFALETQSFGSWCDSVGLNRKAAERLLQVSRLFDASSPKEEKVLEELSPSLLYAAAKPSAPAELVQGVKNGDITTHKQYQEAMARIKQMEKDAELDRKERDNANAAAMRYKAEADRRAADQQRLEGLVATRERERDTAIQDAKRARKEQEESERLADDEIARVQRIADDANDRANTAEARVKELEGRPIEVTGADASDIARWRAEGAEQARQEVADTMAAMQEQVDDADAAQGNVVDALYIMAQQIAANCTAQLENWGKAAACLTQDAYMDCVQQLDPLRIQILQMMMEGAEDEEMS